nr:MAG TPA: hypothetical protein [Caudoviricetes sp.]
MKKEMYVVYVLSRSTAMASLPIAHTQHTSLLL